MPRAHGNVSLRFCIVYCSQRNREQPAHYLKQYKNAGKCFRVYGALEVQRQNAIMVDRGRWLGNPANYNNFITILILTN